MKLTKSEKYAWLGTVISSIIILLILLLVFLPGIKEEEVGGLMISFGEVDDGSGNSMQPSEAVAMPIPPVNTPEDKLLTQDKPSVVIDDSKNKPEEKPVTRPVTTPVVDSKLEKEEQATQRADDVIGGTFGTGTNQGSGSGTNDAPAGNPLGQGQSGGNSWSLTGRNLLGEMPKPRYEENEEGFITVEIRVDAKGIVTNASVKRANISSTNLRNAAVEAARRTRFSAGNGIVVGVITYNFKLR